MPDSYSLSYDAMMFEKLLSELTKHKANCWYAMNIKKRLKELMYK